MKTCLVTGGAGFLGSHLVAHLLEHTDWNVVVWDEMSYASIDHQRLREIEAFSNSRFAFHELDIVEIGPADTEQFDFIVHLAAHTHVDTSIRESWPFVRSNVVGTHAILEHARRQMHLKKLLYFSTDEVFGPSLTTPEESNGFHEDSRHNPSNPYAATKSAGEELALAWANTYNLPVTVSHCCNIFGERQHEEKYIPRLIGQISRGETVQIHAREDGVSGSRMYVYAGDVARAIVLLLGHGEITEKYNIPGVEISNRDMATKIAAIMERSLIARMVYPYKERPGWDFAYRLTGGKLKELGWKPTENFDALLRQVVDHELRAKAKVLG